MSGEPPIWGGGAVDGPGWSALMAWTGLVLGVGAVIFAFTAPLWGRPFGLVWIAGFGALAVWFGGVGWLRLRRRGGTAQRDHDGPHDGEASDAGSPLGAGAGLAGAVLGAVAIALMAYAWAAFVAADAGVEWPMPPAWHPQPGEGPLTPPGDVSI
ncbi:hypothetical protein [Agromyces sp. LHK192]|uniref:hypothetical protein n=1 Tax=Agromyces sp. LHK192 TaxID=2498704 RepID=UPI0013E3F96F|nr:hypothetical protein [Agromyces sp. LHK192]